MRARFLVLALFPFASCTCEDELGELNGALIVEPPMLDFGMVPRDLVKELPLTLKNRGSFLLNIEGYTADAPFIAPASTSSIVTGGMTEVKVGFRPSELGPTSGVLQIMSDDPKLPVVEVPLMGTGIEAAVRVDPPMIDFGEILWVAGTEPMTRMVTVSNPGSDAFELTEIGLSEGGTLFTLDPMDVKKTYAPGESGTFTVSYKPNARVAVTGSVRIATTTRMAPEIFLPLRGKGVGPELQICALPPSGDETCTADGEIPRVHFDDIPINTTAQGTVRVKNAGDRDLVIGSVFLTGEQPEFSFTPSVPSTGDITLSPGQENTWTVTYGPVNYAFDAVLMGFASNDPGGFPPMDPRGARSVDIRGGVRSPRIRVQPGSLTFTHSGAVSHGETPVRIYNCGAEPLTITADVVLTQTAGPEPALSLMNGPSAGTVIMPQAMCDQGPAGAEMRVVFDTTTNGNYTAEIPVESNDPTMTTVTVRVTATKR